MNYVTTEEITTTRTVIEPDDLLLSALSKCLGRTMIQEFARIQGCTEEEGKALAKFWNELPYVVDYERSPLTDANGHRLSYHINKGFWS